MVPWVVGGFPEQSYLGGADDIPHHGTNSDNGQAGNERDPNLANHHQYCGASPDNYCRAIFRYQDLQDLYAHVWEKTWVSRNHYQSEKRLTFLNRIGGLTSGEYGKKIFVSCKQDPIILNSTVLPSRFGAGFQFPGNRFSKLIL